MTARHPGPSRAWIAACGVASCVLALAACEPRGNDSKAPDERTNPKSAGYRPPPAATTEILEVPATGISLGWGWNNVSGESVPSICIEFVEAKEPAQARFMTMHEVSDSYELMQRLGLSAEASVKTIGYSVGGKASFAKNLDVTSFASNFVMNARVENGVRYAAPVPANWRAANADASLIGPRGGLQGELRLTPEALKLARAGNPQEFVHRCGHGFVAAVYGGAMLTAVITVNTSSRAEREQVSAELSGSGWGARFKAAMNQSAGTKTEKKDMNVSIFQVGGRRDSIPVTKEDVIKKLEVLSSIAEDAPKDFQMAVAPYETLANWPPLNIEVESSEYDQVASLWGAYNTLYDDIQEALDRPAEFVAPIVGDNGCVAVEVARPLAAAQIARLERVQDEVLETLGRLRKFAQHCATADTGCEFPEGEFRSPYAYRIQLPLEVPPELLDKKPGSKPPPPPAFAAADVLNAHVAGPAKRRCEADSGAMGCLSNAAIHAWGEKVGMDVRKFASMQERDEAAKRLSQRALVGEPATCPARKGQPGPAISSEPGYAALWYHPQVAACIDGGGKVNDAGHCLPAPKRG